MSDLPEVMLVPAVNSRPRSKQGGQKKMTDEGGERRVGNERCNSEMAGPNKHLAPTQKVHPTRASR